MSETRKTPLRRIRSVASFKSRLSWCRVSRETQCSDLFSDETTLLPTEQASWTKNFPFSTRTIYTTAVLRDCERMRARLIPPYHHTGHTPVKLSDTQRKASCRPRQCSKSPARWTMLRHYCGTWGPTATISDLPPSPHRVRRSIHLVREELKRDPF